MPHCSSIWFTYPTDLCFLRIPLCPPHLAAHIPMSRHFFIFCFSDPFRNHRIQSDDGTQKIKLAGPAKRFQILIVLTIRAL
jgi:hypothetical protein